MRAEGGSHDDRLLAEVEAADFLRMSIRTLQAWRSQRVGLHTFALVALSATDGAI